MRQELVIINPMPRQDSATRQELQPKNFFWFTIEMALIFSIRAGYGDNKHKNRKLWRTRDFFSICREAFSCKLVLDGDEKVLNCLRIKFHS